MGWITSDGQRIWAQVHEPATPAHSGRSVLFTHGYMQDSRGFHHQVAQLVAAGHRVVVWDLPGHGHSPAPTDALQCTIDRLADHLVAVAQACAPDDELVLVGHSMGGMTMMQLGIAHGEWLERRVVAAAFLATQATGDSLASFGTGPRGGRATKRAAAPLTRLLALRWGWPVVHALGPALELVVLATCCGAGTTRADTVLTVDMAGDAGFATMRDYLPALVGHSRAAGLAAYRRVPTLVLGGSWDGLVPPRDCAQVARALPGSRLVVVPRAGHNVMLAAPRLVGDELQRLAQQ